MKYPVSVKKSFLFSCVFVFGLPSIALADATDSANFPRDTESSIEVEYFSMGDASSNIGDAQVGASGLLVQTEYETDDIVFSFNYERWNYNWTNPASLPFVSGTGDAPWSTFNTLQFGLAYEHEINDKWEFNYYVEAESSFEKETSGSNEYEVGIDFVYKASDTWTYILNVNMEYLDATGGELGVDLEIEWNHARKEGWSGEFEISSEFPETSLTYHFTKAISTTMFYGEGGTNTIRLSDSSLVTGMQGGYFEDEYSRFGMRLDYEFAHESYLSFSVQQNTDRSFSFIGKSGKVETSYEFADTVEASVGITYTF